MHARFRYALWLSTLTALAAMLTGCPDDPEPEPEPAEGIYADELGAVIPTATPEQKEAFERGKEAALRRFTTEDGLGPKFNVSFCGACHEKPTLGGSSPRYRNFLLVSSEQADGSVIPVGTNGVQTQFQTDEVRVATDPAANVLSQRNAIPFFGTGLIAELPERSILKHADPDDDDGDGISGRPNYDRGFVGRFGRKAQTVSIEGFIRGPLFNHLGVTSNPLSQELKAQLPVPSALDQMAASARFAVLEQAQAAAPSEPNFDDDGVPDPELSEQELFDIVSFSMLLAPPKRDELTPETELGQQLFRDAGCDDCHVESLEGPRGLIFPYSDFLLHDMGPELADGIEMGVASGSEFRTQPLWGVAAVAPYLHDGRADTLDEAIRWHGGEAEASRMAYEEILLPPDYTAPPAGELGGPAEALSDADRATFEKGARVFDRDIAMSEGLGPNFNGDSCRACHFDPVIAGAGPADVNVTRHGYVDGSGEFTAPDQGTMAHHQTVHVDERAPADEDATVWEFRQTPPIFGLGLLDRVPDDSLIALADPQDSDLDGISGRIHRLPDGRIGRLGWKANVPSVEEFARDALSGEVGLSVPERQGQSFGFLSDGDAWPDPEISDGDYDALVFYMENLAPPKRRSTDPEAEERGEALFEQIGCDGCHVPQLVMADGTRISPYTDLLLHDVAEPDATGIEVGEASIREFRTPPLWGIGLTGPYMHHGLAPTLDAAIRDHYAEALESREAYENLTQSERDAVIAFLESL